MSSDLWLPRPWLGLSSLALLRNPGTDAQLSRRYEANPFVSLTASGLLPQPRFVTHPLSMMSAIPRVPSSLGGPLPRVPASLTVPPTEHSSTSRSTELAASTTNDQKLPSSSGVTTVTSSTSLPASKLLGPADDVPAYLDFRSRDVASTNGLVVPPDSRRVSPV